jgi:hypothetical protein
MLNKILIIYPQDGTTDFLQGIPNFLFERLGRERFIYQRIGFSNYEHDKCIEIIEKFHSNSTVIFLGHGRSDALLGAFDEERFNFATHDNISIFKNKNVFFLSCRSRDYLNNQGINGIGFGHILTSTSELNDVNIRRQFSFLYSSQGMPDSPSIDRFKEILVNIVSLSLYEYINLNCSISQLYTNLNIRFNKYIVSLIKENDPLLICNLANLLFKAKSEIRLYV